MNSITYNCSIALLADQFEMTSSGEKIEKSKIDRNEFKIYSRSINYLRAIMRNASSEMDHIVAVIDPADRESFARVVASIRKEHGISEEECPDSQIYRFFRGQQKDAAKAILAILANFQWRKTAPFKEAAELDLKKFDLFFEHVHMGFYGVDIDGRPIRIIRPLQFDPEVLATKYTVDDRFMYALQNMERVLNIIFPLCSKRANRFIEGMISIVDVEEISIGKMFNGIGIMNTFKSHSAVLQENYPEMTHRAIIINAGFLFTGLWNVIKVFMNKNTIAKITILGSDFMYELLKFTTMENLPKAIGGTCEHHINNYPNFFAKELADSICDKRLTMKGKQGSSL